MAKATYTNIAPGPRGGYLDGELIEVAPGQSAELDDAPEEWFAKANTKDAKAAAEPAKADSKSD